VTRNSDDIVQRLRAEADAHADGNWSDQVIRKHLTEAADEIERLRAALTEIASLHVPEWVSEAAKAAGKKPWTCETCGVEDGSWPCSTMLIIEELQGDE
jgi:hypothetical protein